MFLSVHTDYLIFETIITYAPGISHQYTIICSISTVDQIHMNAKWRTNYAQKSQFVVRSLIKKRENNNSTRVVFVPLHLTNDRVGFCVL
mmetsp:Transcript_39068/g.94491  ORF Transcript_39068/g.94491 Transcript_39068/m.94491 type:complete len:89 (-) Transcript_39068:1715-1981(-)